MAFGLALREDFGRADLRRFKAGVGGAIARKAPGNVSKLRDSQRKALTEIVARSCPAWNTLIEQPWKSLSIGPRDRAQRF